MNPNTFPFPKTMPDTKTNTTKLGMPQSTKGIADIVSLHRSELLEKARLLRVGTVHIFDTDEPKGGMTVAFRKSSNFKLGKMVDCAVAVCSGQDTFSKKIGTTLALEKFFDGETIALPLLTYYEPRDLNGVVKRAFTALYYSV